MRTLEPGHRFDPSTVGLPDSSPILVDKLMSELPFGARYRARQGKTTYIVTTYDRRLVADPEFRRRLERGLASAISAEHPNLIRPLGFDLAGVVPFSVFDDPRCTTLAQFLAKRRAKGKSITPATANRLMSQVFTALGYLHPQTVHGFLTTGHALVDTSGHLRVLGVGEGLLLPVSPGFQVMVAEGKLARPGRELLESTGTPSPATDIYAAAALYFELITGRPFDDLAALDALVGALPHQEVNAMRRALSPDPRARFSSVDEYRSAMMDAQAGPASSPQHDPDRGPALPTGNVPPSGQFAAYEPGAPPGYGQPPPGQAQPRQPPGYGPPPGGPGYAPPGYSAAPGAAPPYGGGGYGQPGYGPGPMGGPGPAGPGLGQHHGHQGHQGHQPHHPQGPPPGGPSGPMAAAGPGGAAPFYDPSAVETPPGLTMPDAGAEPMSLGLDLDIGGMQLESLDGEDTDVVGHAGFEPVGVEDEPEPEADDKSLLSDVIAQFTATDENDYFLTRGGVLEGPYQVRDMLALVRASEIETTTPISSREYEGECLAVDHPALRPVFELVATKLLHDEQLAKDQAQEAARHAARSRTTKLMAAAVVFAYAAGAAGLFFLGQGG